MHEAASRKLNPAATAGSFHLFFPRSLEANAGGSSASLLFWNFYLMIYLMRAVSLLTPKIEEEAVLDC
jgi:hypothetical protein